MDHVYLIKWTKPLKYVYSILCVIIRYLQELRPSPSDSIIEVILNWVTEDEYDDEYDKQKTNKWYNYNKTLILELLRRRKYILTL